MRLQLDGVTVDLAGSYAWLGSIGPLPKIVLAALGTYGVVETPGPGNTPAIMSWDAALVRAGVLTQHEYDADATPWCGLGMAYWALVAGKPVQDKPLWAMNWAKYGQPIAWNTGTIAKPMLAFGPGDLASLGDILVFSRKVVNAATKAVSYAGHVGEYIAEDESHYHVLGANQGDRVSIVRIEKKRCIGIRRPPFKTAMPASAKPYHVAPTGLISTSEA